MPEVLLNNEDITVLGSPSTVEVLVDIGPTGTRGSQVFAGIGDPNDIEIGQTPILNDLYINASPGVNYGYMYQYVSSPGGNTWVQILSVNPTIYSKNHLTTFTSGTAEIIIPISDIITTTGTALTAENFSVQYSIIHDNPIASSMTIPALVGAGDNLVIDLTAVESTSGVWSSLDAEVTTHIFISIIASEAP